MVDQHQLGIMGEPDAVPITLPDRPYFLIQSPFPEDERAHFLPDVEITHEECPTHENPMKVDKPFWKYMIAHGNNYAFHVRKYLDVKFDRSPIFCFMRVGRTETLLPTAGLSTSAASMRTITTATFLSTMTWWLCADMVTAVKRQRRPRQNGTQLSAGFRTQASS